MVTGKLSLRFFIGGVREFIPFPADISEGPADVVSPRAWVVISRIKIVRKHTLSFRSPIQIDLPTGIPIGNNAAIRFTRNLRPLCCGTIQIFAIALRMAPLFANVNVWLVLELCA